MGPVSGGDSWLPGVVIQPRLICCCFFSMFGVVNCHVVDDFLAQWRKLLLFISRPPCSSDWMLIVEANIVDF